MSKRTNHDAASKARVELGAQKDERTVSVLAATIGVHPKMIYQWKKSLLEGAAGIFGRGGLRADRRGHGPRSACQDWEPVGCQRFFCQKAQAKDREVRLRMIEPNQPALSIGRQCPLLSIFRSSFYYSQLGETDTNRALMRLFDKQFLDMRSMTCGS